MTFCGLRETRENVNLKVSNASDSTKVVRDTSDSKHSFIFHVGVDVTNIDSVNGLLVDCGATTHIVHDVSKFVRFDAEFNPEHHIY
jgi:hypothetical protein